MHHILDKNKMSEKSNTLKRDRILIIDDSPAIQRLTKQILTFQKEYDIQFATNGKQAVELILNSDPFKITMIDMGMPVMGGKDFIQKMRNLKNQTKARSFAIACTGNAEEFSTQEFKEMGFDDVFIKPIDYKKLLGKIKEVLEKTSIKERVT